MNDHVTRCRIDVLRVLKLVSPRHLGLVEAAGRNQILQPATVGEASRLFIAIRDAQRSGVALQKQN
jgi:hypothetical protein